MISSGISIHVKNLCSQYSKLQETLAIHAELYHTQLSTQNIYIRLIQSIKSNGNIFFLQNRHPCSDGCNWHQTITCIIEEFVKKHQAYHCLSSRQHYCCQTLGLLLFLLHTSNHDLIACNQKTMNTGHRQHGHITNTSMHLHEPSICETEKSASTFLSGTHHTPS